MVLNANPHGRSDAEQGAYCERTNEDNVDLNRNYGFHWEAESGDFSSKPQGDGGVGPGQGKAFEPYSSGSSAFSEPETRIVARLMNETRPDVFLDVHSGTKGLFMPRGWTQEPLDDDDGKRMQAALADIGQNDCPECLIGNCANTLGYMCPGSAADYAYSQGVKFPFTWEIYADDASFEEDVQSQQKFKAAAATAREQDSSGMAPPSPGATSFLARSSRSSKGPSDDIPEDMEADAEALSSLMDDKKEHCFCEFNPTTEDAYTSTLQRWSRAYSRLVDRARHMKSQEQTPAGAAAAVASDAQ
eukprot:gnl/TRDRNA2_/TRDRNA2_39656_c0_seq1.p1 gnl/TRDRNA2_/TRDRNA2_39656_c0~~gnl/TRDRNA2_/TRDRNA2_39656_c0_seq1.p1  ORF type:complete len:338 (-),score=59.33 gnl/TRDRNA2_/TRDRNA2_39656_c0_seq1:55-960(-)